MNDSLAWWKQAVFYQIYPRSFMDSNGDGVGDLQGIIQRLDYLVDLGVDAVWISPIYPSPMADFGYDVSDYTGIHPLFGDMATFDRLLAEAHARGLKIVLDYVPNHTSDEHPWFIESRSSRDNPRRDWYIWKDPQPDGSPPNNWESRFGGPAWTWDEPTGQYYLHLFLAKQPDLNWRNPDVVAAMHDVLRFWLDKGVDGFRIDVVTFMIKHADFPDNPPIPPEQRRWDNPRTQEHVYDISQPEIHGVLRDLRRIFGSYPGNRVMIGETIDLDPRKLVQYYGQNLDELQIPFNFSLLWCPWDAQQMWTTVEAYYAAMPKGAMPDFVLGNHDRHRLATRYGPANARAAALLLLTLWGVPTMYYGDEIGMEDVPIPPDQMQDPRGINAPEANVGRDPERSPMQWDASPNAGFAAAGVRPWLPVAENYRTVNVAAQMAESTSMLHFVRALLRLRRAMPVLHAEGDFRFVDGLPDDILAYTRTQDGLRVLVVLNFGGDERTLDLSALGPSGEVLVSTGMDRNGPVSLYALNLGPHEGLLLRG
jgi:alpha-glucosidase